MEIFELALVKAQVNLGRAKTNLEKVQTKKDVT